MNKEIEFEGRIIKLSKSGVYKCPFNCGDKRYPSPKWKTEKGFMNHLKNCNMRPSAVNERIKKTEEKNQTYQNYKNILDSFKTQILNDLPYKIGDEIFYIKKIVVKDTHELRGNRMVKIRYEQELRYEAVKETIKEINFIEPKTEPTLENIKEFIYFNNGIYLNSIYTNYVEAINVAKEKTKADEEARNFASMCR